MKIIVSSCLLGNNCKYNGKNNYNPKLIDFLKQMEIIEVCPEQMGGLSTPRLPSEIKGDIVINKEGIDVTPFFQKGACKTLEIAKNNSCKVAILKSNSPSCGFGSVYDGTFSSKLKSGNGVTAVSTCHSCGGHQLFFRKIFQNTVDKHSFCYGIVKGFTDDGGIGKKFPEIFSGYPDAVCADIQIWIDLFQQ